MTRPLKLDDKYTARAGRVYMSGVQALVRLPLVQRWRDEAQGLKTAGFISGYRGSPLAGYDQELHRAKTHLAAENIVFQPGLNEELAATAVWGTQQSGLWRTNRYDGVFGIWYGKGPGLDRSMDVLKHANAAGTAPQGGVLCIVGDDHACKSSTLPHQSDHNFMAALMPVLYPASLREFVEFGLLGIAMSRYSGCWVGLKVTSETADSSGTVDLASEGRAIVQPTDFELPAGGVNIRWPDQPREQDWRLQRFKGFASHAFARANNIDRIVWDPPKARFGIVASGKSFMDVLQALEELHIDEAAAHALGIRLYKVGMPWPLEPEGARRFAEGLDEVLVVEEKREIIEHQLRWQLYNWKPHVRPVVVGKHDEQDRWLLPPENDLDVDTVARVIAERLSHIHSTPEITAKLAVFQARRAAAQRYTPPIARKAFFCSGCPHNTSTVVPDGSRALAGIGCHYLVRDMPRRTETFTQMGGEGAPWIGQAPFVSESHVFANLGDGTYQHSGILAIRAAIAAGVNITYKILYNDAVAMTGGQSVDGHPTVAQIAGTLAAEGVKRIAIVAEEPERHGTGAFARGTSVHHRDALDEVQRELRTTPGCTVILFDQTCAAEKRRRRKRGLMAEPTRRVFINDAVCEGCGDCSVQSNCVSVEPLETELGRKRQINQSSCNKDYSCLKGFCPSFVTIEGGSLVSETAEQQAHAPAVPDPRLPNLDRLYNVIITGVGGTGVLTVSALIGMAAHLDGKASQVLDMTGLAQKGGAVYSHVHLAPAIEQLRSTRLLTGSADALIACDSVVAASGEAMNVLDAARTGAVVNTHLTPVASFVRERDLDFAEEAVIARLRGATRKNACALVDASALATRLFGDAIAANVFMLGFAWQQGLIPLSRAAIEEAIRLNGTGVAMNLAAFAWGRAASHEPASVAPFLRPTVLSAPRSVSLDDLIDRRAAMLTAYQNAALAERYRARVATVRAAEAALGPGHTGLAEAVARNYAKLLAYKDEYEVARLYSDPAFRAKLNAQFTGPFRLKVHLAPPMLSQPDPRTGRPQKRAFGPWVFALFAVLSRLRRLRGTPFDLFGRTRDRALERTLIRDYERVLDGLVDGLRTDNHALAVELASLPDEIRGFGPVKEEAVRRVKRIEGDLWASFRASPAPARPPQPTPEPLAR